MPLSSRVCFLCDSGLQYRAALSSQALLSGALMQMICWVWKRRKWPTGGYGQMLHWGHVFDQLIWAIVSPWSLSLSQQKAHTHHTLIPTHTHTLTNTINTHTLDLCVCQAPFGAFLHAHSAQWTHPHCLSTLYLSISGFSILSFPLFLPSSLDSLSSPIFLFQIRFSLLPRWVDLSIQESVYSEVWL